MQRRNFLKTAGVAGACAFLPALPKVALACARETQITAENLSTVRTRLIWDMEMAREFYRRHYLAHPNAQITCAIERFLALENTLEQSGALTATSRTSFNALRRELAVQTHAESNRVMQNLILAEINDLLDRPAAVAPLENILAQVGNDDAFIHARLGWTHWNLAHENRGNRELAALHLRKALALVVGQDRQILSRSLSAL